MKNIILTFDDALLSHYDFVRSLLNERDMKGTFFVNSRFMEREDIKTMSWEQLKEMHDDGFEIGNHLTHHVDTTEHDNEKLTKFIIGIEEKLQTLNICKPVSLAYPGFHRNMRVMDLVRNLGYHFARGGCDKTNSFHEYQEGGSGCGFNPIWDNPFNINCLSVFGKNYSIDEFKTDIDALPIEECAILCFHDFDDNQNTSISKDDFIQVVDYIKNTNCKTFNMRDINSLFNFSVGQKEVKHYLSLKETK